jgi:hypothetical protein
MQNIRLKLFMASLSSFRYISFSLLGLRAWLLGSPIFGFWRISLLGRSAASSFSYTSLHELMLLRMKNPEKMI